MPALLVGVAGVAVWCAAYAGCLLWTRPYRVQPAPPTQDFGGPEPPAVVSLLANHWEITEDAAESTLLDLAARKLVELRQPGADPAQTTIHVGTVDRTGLTAYEKRVLDRVTGLATGGVVPLTALTFRDPAQARSWARRLAAEVIVDARARGLSRRRFSADVLAVLAVATVLAAVAVGVALSLWSRHAQTHDDQGFGGALFTFVALAGATGAIRGERDTPAGRAAAARWLGLRAYLRGDESFGRLPPAAVAVWDRYLPYGDALGTARVCAAVIDLGMGNRKRVWSSFGGDWHRVRVGYPRFWGRYGARAVPLVLWSLVTLAAGVMILVYRHGMITPLPERLHRWVAWASLALGWYLALRGAYRLARTVTDLVAPRTLTGEVLWTEVWRSAGGGNNRPPRPWLYYLAVDDGTGDRTTAWGLPAELLGGCDVGDTVRVTVRPWTRRVVGLEVVYRGRAGALREAPAAGDVDALVAAATRPASPLVSIPDRLLPADEVTRLVGVPVTEQSHPGPAAVRTYALAGGGRIILLVAGGVPAKLAMRARRVGTPVPGIGDEAYAGAGWAAARCGATAVLVNCDHAPGVDPVPLLTAAVARLPGAAAPA